jgi:hypothetical protein
MADPSFYEGFEMLTPDTLPLRFERVQSSGVYLIGTGYPGATFPNGRALYFTGLASGASVLRRLLTPHSSGRFAFRWCYTQADASLTGGNMAIAHFEYSYSLSSQFALFVDPVTRYLHLHNGPYGYNTTIGQSTNAIALGTVYHIEVVYTINNTTGSVAVYVDGVQWINVTNVNTRNFNSVNEVNWITLANSWGFGSQSSAFDDLVWAEGTTPLLGPLSVLAAPVNGAGSVTQFTPLSSTNHSNVDDAPGHDGDTSYVESSTDTHEDAYTVAVPDLTGFSVKAVQPMIVARKTDVGSVYARAVLRSGATKEVTAALMGDVYGMVEGTVEHVDPDTSAAWVNADVEDVQVGAEVESV